MSLPDRGWKGYGAPGHKYDSLKQVGAQLRRAAVEADNSNHPLREVAFSRWLSWGPNPAAVNYLIERALGRVS